MPQGRQIVEVAMRVACLLAFLALLVTLFYWCIPRSGATGESDRAVVADGRLDASPARARVEESTVVARSSAVEAPADFAAMRQRFELLRLRVVVRATGAPVPGATVRYAADPSTRVADIESYLRDNGEATVADEDGVAEVPLARRRTVWVAARSGQLYGQLLCRLANVVTGGARLELEPDVSVSVRVVGADGRGVGKIPVGLYGRTDEVLVISAFDTTDVHGRAQICKLWQRLPLVSPPSDENGVVICLPGMAHVRRRFDLASGAPEQVTLQLPPTGRVVVALQDAAGMPLQVGTVDLESERVWAEPGFRAAVDAAGVATFPRVALDRVYTAICKAGHVTHSVDFRGPVLTGVPVRVTLRPLGDAVQVTGVALAERGGPLAGCVLRMRPRLLRFRTNTDRRGRFRFFLNPSDLEAAAIATRLRVYRDHRYLGLSAEVTIPRAEHGVRTLGSVSFVEDPVLVAGRLLESDHDCLPDGATVGVERQVTPRDGSEPIWINVEDCLVRTSPDGDFVIRGSTPPGTLRLVVQSGIHVPVEPIPFAPGTRGVTIRVRRGRTVIVCVRTGRIPLGASTLVATLVGDDQQARWRGHAFDRDSDRVSFRWLRLEPGGYELRLRTFGSGKSFHRQVVRVSSGRQRWHLPTIHVDARQRLRVVDIRVVDGGGQTRDLAGAVVFDPVSPATDREGIAFEHGSAALILSEPSVDLIVAVEGYPSRRVSGVRDRRAVPFPIRRVRFRLDPNVANAGKAGRLQLRAKLMSGESLRFATPTHQDRTSRFEVGWFAATVDAFGGAELDLPVGGRYAMRLDVEGSRSPRLEPASIRVDQSDSLVELRVLPAGSRKRPR